MKQWVDPHAIARLGEGMQLLASVSVDPLIGGMGRGVGYRDLVGKEVAWNEGVEDESMWNESEEEGDDEGKTGGKRWFLHEKTETKEERRMRLAMDENEDEDMETDDELELLGEDDSEWSQAEKSGGPDSELEMSEWGKSDDDFLAAAGF